MTIRHFLLKLKPYLKIPSPLDIIVVFILNILISIPLFLFLHQNIQDLNWKYNLDRVIIFLLLIIIFID